MAEKPKKRNRSSAKLRPFIIITTVIIVLLIVVLVITKTVNRQDVLISEPDYTNNNDKSNEEIINEVDKPSAAPIEGPVKDEKQERDETKKEQPEKKLPHENKPGIPLAFVIDDVGNSIEDLKPFLDLPFAITFAIMPDRKFTKQSASMISSAGREYILHQPMEAFGGEDPGNSAIYNNMSQTEIYNILQHNFAQLPEALGMNNHMGSAATSNTDTMSKVMSYLAENKKFFFDSFTTSDSVVISVAERNNVKSLQRNSMFLDNENDKESIIKAIETGKKTAKKKGYAIMIGHAMTNELAEIMLELYPDFIEEGFSLKEISEIFLDLNNPENFE